MKAGKAGSRSGRRVAQKRKGIVFVISSVSGGGKTTLINRVLGQMTGLALSVSHTTRPPRRGETEGVEYSFVSEDRFHHMVRKGRFLEWAVVHGNLYGTSKDAVSRVLDSGKDVLLDIDVQGALQIRKRWPSCVMVFIVPPPEEGLRRRLSARGTETDEEIETRLRTARRELAFVEQYDYAVPNENLEDAILTLRSVIVAERCRIPRRKPRPRRGNLQNKPKQEEKRR